MKYFDDQISFFFCFLINFRSVFTVCGIQSKATRMGIFRFHIPCSKPYIIYYNPFGVRLRKCVITRHVQSNIFELW